MPRLALYWVDPDSGEQHLLGVEVFENGVSASAAQRSLMDKFWDTRLDAAGCTPLVANLSSNEELR